MWRTLHYRHNGYTYEIELEGFRVLWILRVCEETDAVTNIHFDDMPVEVKEQVIKELQTWTQ